MEKSRKRLVKIFQSGCLRTQEEVSALLGKNLNVAEPETTIVGKEEFFSELSGKYVFVRIGVSGEVACLAGMMIPVESAIRIGGTLIMLPDSELSNLIGSQEYSEEIQDSFGEIANIICGSLSSTFEEQFPQKVRLVRKEQKVLAPLKVEVESDEPLPDGQFFVSAAALAIDDKEIGKLYVLLPAEPFGLIEPPVVQEQVAAHAAESTPRVGAVQQGEGVEVAAAVKEAPKGLTRKKLDKAFNLGFKRLQEEVSVLLGKDLELEEPEFMIAGKEECFFELAGKVVYTTIGIQGAVEGKGGLLVSLDAAIRIGGTLIMLPETELENCISEQEYSDDLEDSFGEIANIMCGAITSTFEEQLAQGIRLIKQEQEIVLPLKVDVESDKPCPNGTYYLVSSAISMAGDTIGTLHFLLPAENFGLLPKEAPVEAPQSVSAAVGKPSGLQPVAESVSGAGVQAAQAVVGVDPTTKQAAQKQKKKIDRFVVNVFERVQEDVGGLLGGELSLAETQITLCDKESFLDATLLKQVMARVDVRGPVPGEAYLFVPLKDAILLGGTLIMLPAVELDQVIANDDFSADLEDAYGEVANIIAGCYTTVFEEYLDKTIGFTKKSLEVVSPGKVDPDSDEVLLSQGYYLTSALLRFNEREMGRIQFLIPASVLQLEPLFLPDIPEESIPATTVAAAGVGGAATADAAYGTGAQIVTSLLPDVIIISDDTKESGAIGLQLKKLGFNPEILHFKDPVYNYLPGEIRCVFLVMSQINELGFGVAIKINSAAPNIPLILAGPAWTRTLVLKAVKYGADDILLTPSTSEDVMEKVESHLRRIAA